MSLKTTVDKIFKRVWSDFHITPEEFELNRRARQDQYDSECEDFTDEDRERIKNACELFSLLIESTDADEIKKLGEQFEAEYKTLNLSQKIAVEYFRAECLAKKYKDKDCYTTRKVKEGYRQFAKRVRERGRY